jgi:hypothetical protein
VPGGVVTAGKDPTRPDSDHDPMPALFLREEVDGKTGLDFCLKIENMFEQL